MMQPPGNPAATPLQDLHTRYAPTMLWPPAREVFDARVRRDLNALTQVSAPAPARQPAAHDFLSQTALQHRAAAYEKILMDAVLAGRAQGAAEVAGTTPKTDENEKSPETPLERADTAEPPNHPQNENKRFCNSFATGLRADFENASKPDGENEDEEEEIDSWEDITDEEYFEAIELGLAHEDEVGKDQNSAEQCEGNPTTCWYHSKHPQIGKIGTAASLGLGKLDEIKPDKAFGNSEPKRALRRLSKGKIVVKSIDGKRVVFDKNIPIHWSQVHKPHKEKQRRLAYLSEAVRAVTNPHEVWELPNKQRTYLRVYQDETGKLVMSGFVVGKNNRVRSFFHDYRVRSNGVEKKRQGKLIYKRVDQKNALGENPPPQATRGLNERVSSR